MLFQPSGLVTGLWYFWSYAFSAFRLGDRVMIFTILCLFGLLARWQGYDLFDLIPFRPPGSMIGLWSFRSYAILTFWLIDRDMIFSISCLFGLPARWPGHDLFNLMLFWPSGSVIGLWSFRPPGLVTGLWSFQSYVFSVDWSYDLSSIFSILLLFSFPVRWPGLIAYFVGLVPRFFLRLNNACRGKADLTWLYVYILLLLIFTNLETIKSII